MRPDPTADPTAPSDPSDPSDLQDDGPAAAPDHSVRSEWSMVRVQQPKGWWKRG